MKCQKKYNQLFPVLECNLFKKGGGEGVCLDKIKHVYVNMNTVSVLNCFNDNKMEKTGKKRERKSKNKN